MTWTIPDKGEGANDLQSVLFQSSLDALVAGHVRTGVVTGCSVAAQGTPDMTVAVAAGTVSVAGNLVLVTSGNVTIGTADATNPRLDLIVCDNAGVKSVIAGTAAAAPVEPTLDTSTYALLAQVYVPAAATTITTARITDRRAMVTTTPPMLVPLRQWRTALAKRQSRRVKIMVFGDSFPEGQKVTAPMTSRRRFVDQLVSYLQARYNPAGVTGGLGFVKACYNSAGPTGTLQTPWTYTGTNTTNQGRTPSSCSINLATTTGSMTGTFTCTGFEIAFWQGSAATTPWTYTIDGGSPVTVTPSTTGGLNNNGVATVTGLTAGSHTIVITAGSGGNAYIDGVWIFNGDDASGIHMIEQSRFGWTAGNMVSAWVSYTGHRVGVWQPDLVIITFALNDYQTQVAPATFQSNVQTLISNVKAAVSGYTPSFLLMAPYRRTDVTDSSQTSKWNSYLKALAAVAAADPTNVAFFSVTDRLDTSTSTYSLLNADGVHANDDGHLYISDALVSLLQPA